MSPSVDSDPGPLEFVERTSELEVAFEQAALKVALTLCAESPRRETGGILIGRYIDGGRRAHVLEATGPPPGSAAGRDWFERGNRGLATLLKKRWDAEPRTFYLGEWHFHTDRVPWPSPQDLRQMQAVAADREYRCANPILLLISPVDEGRWSPQVFLFGSGMRPTQLVMAAGRGGDGGGS